MRITGLTLQTVSLPEVKPFKYRGGVLATKRVLLTLHTDEGLTGMGEVMPIPTDWGHPVEALYLILCESIAPALMGMNPFDVEAIWARVAQGVSIDQVPHSMLVERAGVDVALYDLMGKAAGVPLHALLGGRTGGERIPVAAVIGLDTPERMAEQAVSASHRGHTDFKVKVGVDPVEDVRRVAALREALGPGPTIRVDANGGWTPTQAVTVIRRMERYDLELVEQPVPGWDFDGLAFVRGKVEAPIMVDESLHSIHDALLLAGRGCCDFFNVKIQRLGGLTPSRKVLHIAEAAGIKCMLGGEIESGIGTATGVHFIASSRLFTVPGDLVGPGHFSDDILVDPFTIEGGSIALPTGPGLGVTLDADKVRRYAIQMRTVGDVAATVAPQ